MVVVVVVLEAKPTFSALRTSFLTLLISTSTSLIDLAAFVAEGIASTTALMKELWLCRRGGGIRMPYQFRGFLGVGVGLGFGFEDRFEGDGGDGDGELGVVWRGSGLCFSLLVGLEGWRLGSGSRGAFGSGSGSGPGPSPSMVVDAAAACGGGVVGGVGCCFSLGSSFDSESDMGSLAS